jgi:acyl dehydratase
MSGILGGDARKDSVPHGPETLAESLAYEDVDLKAEYVTQVHTVSAEDIETFGVITRDRHPLHEDDAFARSMGFSARIAHGLYGLSLMEGLKAELGLYTTTSVASLGWDDVRFRGPIYVGDQLYARVRFLEKRPSRKPGRGVAVEAVELVNQRNEAVITARHATLVVMRSPDVETGTRGE